jgi:RNA recognition motif-containing protein
MRQRRSNVEDVPTFRVFVKYARPLATEQEETELRGLFEGCGKVTRFTTRLGQWCNSFVTFSSTDGAKKAREKLRGTSFQGQALDVQFAAPARRVVVRGFPRQVSFARVAEVFRLHRNVQIERDDIWQGNEDVAILFARVNDAKEFVIDVVARAITFEGHTPMQRCSMQSIFIPSLPKERMQQMIFNSAMKWKAAIEGKKVPHQLWLMMAQTVNNMSTMSNRRMPINHVWSVFNCLVD